MKVDFHQSRTGNWARQKGQRSTTWWILGWCFVDLFLFFKHFILGMDGREIPVFMVWSVDPMGILFTAAWNHGGKKKGQRSSSTLRVIIQDSMRFFRRILQRFFWGLSHDPPRILWGFFFNIRGSVGFFGMWWDYQWMGWLIDPWRIIGIWWVYLWIQEGFLGIINGSMKD